MVINRQVQLQAGHFLTSWWTISFSRRTLLYAVSSFSKIMPERSNL